MLGGHAAVAKLPEPVGDRGTGIGHRGIGEAHRQRGAACKHICRKIRIRTHHPDVGRADQGVGTNAIAGNQPNGVGPRRGVLVAGIGSRGGVAVAKIPDIAGGIQRGIREIDRQRTATVGHIGGEACLRVGDRQGKGHIIHTTTHGVGHDEGHEVIAGGGENMRRILGSGAVAIAKIPQPLVGIDGVVNKCHRHRRIAALARLGKESGNRPADLDEVLADQRIETAIMLHDQGDVIKPRVLILVHRIRHIRPVAIAKIPVPGGSGSRCQVGEVDVVSHAGHPWHGVKIDIRPRSHFDELENLRVLAAVCRGHRQRYGVLPRHSVGVGGIGQAGKIAVAKVPEPAHNRTVGRNAGVEEIDSQRGAALGDVGQKLSRRHHDANIVRDGFCGLAAVGVGDGKRNGITARSSVHADRVLCGGLLPVAQVPVPGDDVAEGVVGELHGHRGGTTHRVHGAEARRRSWIHRDHADFDLGVGAACRVNRLKGNGVGARNGVGVGGIGSSGGGAVAEIPKVGRGAHGGVEEGNAGAGTGCGVEHHEISHRLVHEDEVGFGLRGGAAVHVRNREAHGVGACCAVGFDGVDRRGGRAVAEGPQIGISPGRAHGGGESHGVGRHTAVGGVGREVDSWRGRDGDQVGLNERGPAAVVVFDYEGDVIAARRGVGVAGVLGGGHGAVAEVPGPGVDGAVGGGRKIGKGDG